MYVVLNCGNRQELHEMSPAQFERDRACGASIRRVSAEQAHAWVRRGDYHMTGLWIDDTGRVRYARPGV